MTYGMIIIITLLAIVVLSALMIWETWKFYLGYDERLKKLEKKLSSYSPKLKTKGKVIPYVRPAK
jgi:hypothetical protein